MHQITFILELPLDMINISVCTEISYSPLQSFKSYGVNRHTDMTANVTSRTIALGTVVLCQEKNMLYNTTFMLALTSYASVQVQLTSILHSTPK